MSPQDGFPLHTTEDVSAKRAHTPKPTSSVHNAPLRETQHTTEFFHNVLPANRVVLGSQKAKLANYTKFFKLCLSVSPIGKKCKREFPNKYRKIKIEHIISRQHNHMSHKTLFSPYFSDETTLVAKTFRSFNLIIRARNEVIRLDVLDIVAIEVLRKPCKNEVFARM